MDDAGRLVPVDLGGPAADVELLPLGTTGRALVLGPSVAPTELDELPQRGEPLPFRTVTTH